jgi:hypothetical protein
VPARCIAAAKQHTDEIFGGAVARPVQYFAGQLGPSPPPTLALVPLHARATRLQQPAHFDTYDLVTTNPPIIRLISFTNTTYANNIILVLAKSVANHNTL